MSTSKTLALVLLAGTILSSCKKPEMTVDSNIEVPVGVIEVGTSTIEEYINTTGTVAAMKEVILTSEMAGKYKLQNNPSTGKPYAIGDKVKEGAVIIKLEDAEYYNGLRLKSKEVDLEISKQEYEKQKSLYEKGGATLRELKDAEIGLINTEYDIESSQISLEKMTVKSPFSGVISNLPYFTEGTKVNSGEELVKIINYSSLYMETNLPEKYYSSISKGFKVYITSYTNPEDTLVGNITQISPEIDPEARTFACFVEIDNRERILLPGMFVRADLVVNSSENALVIPKDIVQNWHRQQMVYVVDKGTANMRMITTGLENEEEIEVTSGLVEGEVIVNKGFETLRHQSKVKITK